MWYPGERSRVALEKTRERMQSGTSSRRLARYASQKEDREEQSRRALLDILLRRAAATIERKRIQRIDRMYRIELVLREYAHRKKLTHPQASPDLT